MRTIILSEIPWGYLKQRHHYFSEFFSESSKVTYVERMGFRAPSFSEVLLYLFSKFSTTSKKKNKSFDSSLKIVSCWLLPGHSRIVRLINRVLLVPVFSRYILGVSRNEFINYVVYLPSTQTLQILRYALLKNKEIKITYDCVHDFINHPSAPKDIVALESELVEMADVVVADSLQNVDRIGKYGKSPRWVPPGVSLDLFFVDKPNPVINSGAVYFGHFRQDNDVIFINAISSRMKVSIIGVVNPAILSQLDPKIEIFSPLPPQLLVVELKKFEFLLLPYLNKSFSKNIIPAKIFECIALGSPIIVSEHPTFEKYKKFLNIVRLDHVPTFKFEEIRPVNPVDRKEALTGQDWKSRFKLFSS